ncbi:2-hydroxychromene-2-carboxylate isomerase [Roseibium salinum]|uniref:2-hydroxychromene-2-carboxylate isomerase n=1 Tax=Roseibium salinum TaxID=1604349 RepID=A0ABT3R6V2_9HYPH|nr:2-hydroxychromene-2-carboxylate isomerase [Roseibium sp. DSM 29163]MCX2725022.1 2-hydroxychromene-2-carboxylate isomerase [Roseibium sp. DSM 29163]
MRIEAVSRDLGVSIVWRPFLLGPIFKKQGWSTSPFNFYPAKGRYMVRDMERQCERYGLPFTLPEPFPQQSLLAARIACRGRNEAWVGAFTRAVFMAEFGQGLDISDEGLLAAILLEVGAPAKQVLAEAHAPAAKDDLRAAVAEAEERGIFGAPSFVAPNGELFWGDDRLEIALEAVSETV